MKNKLLKIACSLCLFVAASGSVGSLFANEIGNSGDKKLLEGCTTRNANGQVIAYGNICKTGGKDCRPNDC